MRTTLTLDEDIGVQIERLRESKKLGLKEIVNRAMRLGLAGIEDKRTYRKKKFQTRVFSAKRSFLGDTVKSSEMLALAEGDDFR